MHIKENIGEKTTFFDKISIIQNSFFLVFFADSNFFVSCFYINIITIIVCKAVMERNRLVKKKNTKNLSHTQTTDTRPGSATLGFVCVF